MNNEINHLIEFENFRLDPERQVLWHDGRQIHLPLKELAVLRVLVEGRGELVTKDELLEKVWADSFVEESNLSRQIYLLRKTFKDLGVSDGLIETVPRRGYRFTGKVREDHTGNRAVTVEKYSQSRTLIEIEEEVPDEPNRSAEEVGQESNWYFRSGLHRLMVASALVGGLLIGVIAFSAYRYNAGAAPASGIKSIAVLPFRTIEANADNAHHSLGLADILITRLSNIKEISVRPLGSVSGFEHEDPRALGRNLQVDAVLEGSIFRTGDKVRVIARLLRTLDGSVVWTGEFERLLRDEIKLQDEIALQVADALAVNLSGSEKAALAKPYTANTDALVLYQKGRIAWNKRKRDGMVDAERLFRNATEEDPNFALAYVGLADTLAMNRTRDMELRDALQRALELDPDLGEVHASLGFYEMFHKWDWRAAEEAFKRSIDLNPNYATAHHWYAQLLAVEGRHEEAKAEMKRALEINPLSHNYLADLGQIYYFNREYAEAEEYCRKALEIYPDFVFARAYLFQIYLKTGEYDRAVEEILSGEKSASTFPNESAGRQKEILDALAIQRKIFREGGIRRFIENRSLGIQNEDSCYPLAMNYSFLGDADTALTCLEKAQAGRGFLTPYIKAEPAFDILRNQPRYTQILRSMNLAE